MTTYIPSLTLPGQVFANPASSILLPMALGTGIGFVVRRTLVFFLDARELLTLCSGYYSQRNSEDLHGIEAASIPTSPSGLWTRMDHPLWAYGICRIQSMGYGNVLAQPKDN